MDYWIYDYDHRFIVHLDRIDAALDWLSENGIKNPHFIIEMGGEIGIVDSRDGMFGGDAYKCVDMEDAHEFIKKFCEPGSYACFRNDTEHEFHIIWKNDDEVREKYEQFECPFEKLMNALNEFYAIY